MLFHEIISEAIKNDELRINRESLSFHQDIT